MQRGEVWEEGEPEEEGKHVHTGLPLPPPATVRAERVAARRRTSSIAPHRRFPPDRGERSDTFRHVGAKRRSVATATLFLATISLTLLLSQTVEATVTVTAATGGAALS